ncbi:MAG: hypothetical protein NTU80_07700 [Verrucomicrobia bacterium]|nr:hypothetical protein [Verrucomicrobiota bacterium]
MDNTPSKRKRSYFGSILSLGLLSLVWAASTAWAADPSPEDLAELATLKAEIAKIQGAVRASNDPAEHERLQAQLDKQIDTSLAKLSMDTRPSMSVMFKVVVPAQAAVKKYVNSAQTFFGGDDANWSSVRSQTELTERQARLTRLIASGTALRTRLDDLENDAMKAMRAIGELPPARRMAIMNGLVGGALRPLIDLRPLRKIEGDLLARYDASFALLNRSWGQWSPGTGEGASAITWTAPESENAAEWKKLAVEIDTLVEKQEKIQEDLALAAVGK